jgi:hypothetical protein
VPAGPPGHMERTPLHQALLSLTILLLTSTTIGCSNSSPIKYFLLLLNLHESS